MQVKIFHNKDITELETELNQFISQRGIELKKITVNTSTRVSDFKHEGAEIIWVTITLWYVIIDITF